MHGVELGKTHRAIGCCAAARARSGARNAGLAAPKDSMSEVVVVKGEDGKLAGLGDKGARAWAKFRARVDAMGLGETLHFSWHEPRSPQHHRLFFAKLHALADRQEQFDTADKLRQWLTVGAGYADFMPGPKGRMVAIPKSIAWSKLDEVEFADLHHQVDAFLWTPHAQEFLWGHLPADKRFEVVRQLMDEFS